MASTYQRPVPTADLAGQRAEYERVAAFPPLKRAPSLSRIFAFVCERYFEGKLDEIKEYTIAVKALGRPLNFDSGADPIVRVSMHSLRKRLEQYYANEGRSHRLQITFPIGRYVPEFVQFGPGSSAAESAPTLLPPPERPHFFPSVQWALLKRAALPMLAAALLIIGSTIAYIIVRSPLLFRARSAAGNHAVPAPAAAVSSSAPQARFNIPATPAAPLPSAQVLRILPGASADYVDSSGSTWGLGKFCSGGSRFHRPGHTILGAADGAIFQSGLDGAADCAIPEPPGTYEVHLLFADTTGAAEAAHHFLLSINHVQEIPLDIVDEAEGDDRAVTKVLTDVHPQADGRIHIGLQSDAAFINAIEVYPGTPHHMLPLRVVAGGSSFTDAQGRAWTADRYFFGGSEARRGIATRGASDPRLFQWEHYGHFRYVLPVAMGDRYKVTLYFSEGYFGPGKMVTGGFGSRVFNVSTPGRVLLRNFDILRETTQANESVVKTFHNIEPNAYGAIELEFEPVRDYALVNAIEVEPESGSGKN